MARRADESRVFVLGHREPADEELADERPMYGALVVFRIGRAHEEVASGDTRQVRGRRGRHRRLGGTLVSARTLCIHHQKQAEYSPGPQAGFPAKIAVQ